MGTVTHNTGVRRAIRLLASRASAIALVVFVTHFAGILVYLETTETTIAPQRAMIPLVWISAAVWLVVHLHDRSESGNPGLLAPCLAIAYLILLGILSGTVGVGGGTTGFRLSMATPGWGPIVLSSVGPVQFTLVPFEVVGYLAISYGVYRAVCATSRGALAGVVGLFTCVSCSLSVIGVVVGAFTGTTTALMPGPLTYELSTGVFLLTVVVLAAFVPGR